MKTIAQLILIPPIVLSIIGLWAKIITTAATLYLNFISHAS